MTGAFIADTRFAVTPCVSHAVQQLFVNSDAEFGACPFQVHGFPRVMGVLTHLDMFKDVKKMRKTKKTLKHRFWTDVYPGAKLFYLSGGNFFRIHLIAYFD